MIKPLLLLSLILLSSNLCAQTDKLQDISDSKEWMNLMRYQKGIFGTSSLVKAKEYFLSNEGMDSPLKELEATISGINSKSIKVMDEHPKCLYPARVMLLKKAGLISNSINLKNCPAYQAYIKKIDLDSVSIIFSSYFIEKPASTFGHTFFRLRSKSSTKENNDLLDYGVDFAAKVDTVNPLIYGIKGIFGGFRGEYSMMPYYVKVKEYNNMESRDLWDYKLNLNAKDIAYFQAHLFEMNRAYFDYLYFSENCSYHILSFLDAIKPEWKLMDAIGVTVPPVDTLYALFDQEDIVKDVRLRPASYTKLKSRYEAMDDNQLELFKTLINDSSMIKEIKDNEDELFVLDTYNLYVDFKNADVDATKSLKSRERKEYQQQKFKINSRRARLNSKSKDLDYTFMNKNSPDKGHRTNRVRLLGSKDSAGEYFNFEIRGALHDLLDKPNGFLPMSTTELGVLKLAYNKYQEDKLRLEEIVFAKIEALRPVNIFSKKISWQLSFGAAENQIYESKTFNPYFHLDLGYTFGNESITFAMLAAMEGNYTFESDYDYTAGIGPKAKIVFSSSRFSTALSYQYMFRSRSRVSETHEFGAEARYHLNKSISFVAGYDYQDSFYKKGYAGINFFYY